MPIMGFDPAAFRDLAHIINALHLLAEDLDEEDEDQPIIAELLNKLAR